MEISIKNAKLDDLEKINEILRSSKSYWGYDTEFIDSFMKKLGVTIFYMQSHTIKLFYVHDDLAGFYSFGMNDENQFELDNFFLHPNYIGQGIGFKLWDACCQTAKEIGQDEFIIWSDPNAEGFYLKMGCEKIGVRSSPMMPGRYPPVLKYKIRNDSF